MLEANSKLEIKVNKQNPKQQNFSTFIKIMMNLSNIFGPAM